MIARWWTPAAAQLRAALLLLACAVIGGCASAPPTEVVASEDLAESATGIAFEGAPDGLAPELARNVDRLLERYVETGKRSWIDDAAYETELYLRQKGFADAVVDYEVLDERKARIMITAAARSTIGRVLVDCGEECPLDAGDLRLYVNGPRTGLFGRGAMLYVQSRVARAPNLVRDDLVALGYLDATAKLEDPGPRPEGGPIDMLLRVRAGQRYYVADASVGLDRTAETLEPSLEEAMEEALRRVVTGEGGERAEYEPRLEGAIRTILSDVLSQGGYPDASIRVERRIEAETKEVSLTVTAFPGPYVRLGTVEFRGADRTRGSFLSSRLLFQTGDPYNSRKVRDTVRALYRTGLFSQVSPRLEGEGDARDLFIQILEQPSREIYAEPGLGSYELARLTVGARDRNLFGNGIGASAEATVAIRALRGNISLTDPWFLKRDLIGDLRLEFDQREEPSFTRESRGVGAFVTKEWTTATATTVGYRLSRSEARDVEAIDAEVLETQSAVNVAGVVLTQRYDIRDALFAPSSGVFAEASIEFATQGFGSELEFIRPKLTAAWFEPLSSDDVLGFGLRLGIIAPALDETSIPIQERFFAGGENSVRSFRESQLGPEDESGQPLGGEGFATASVEWRHELGGAFQTAVFFDAGLVEEQASDLFRLDSVRTGVGAGLRYLLPIGPLRVDAAFNPDRRSTESEWVVHFGIGMPF
ncbi:MAG: BamA/TamA family outer membrane protein [Planctomycetota bacterium]